MSLLRGTIQKKLSALLGARVRLGDLRISLLGGTLDIRDLTIAVRTLPNRS